MIKELPDVSNQGQEAISEGKELILHNDDVNSFDYVIETLMEVCLHEPLQAEQCALIAHYKGKCGVKSGALPEILPPAVEMERRGLTVTIEQ
ncbi:MAG: ATP-dependent Clp protease adaptor ClpS [Bacteroidota bacterium]